MLVVYELLLLLIKPKFTNLPQIYKYLNYLKVKKIFFFF